MFQAIIDNPFKYIAYIMAVLLVAFLVKQFLNLMGFFPKFRWGIFNYWLIKKSRKMSHFQMTFLRNIARDFKIPDASYFVGNMTSFDYYLKIYINQLYQKKMNYWTRIRTMALLLEIRRKFAQAPLVSSKVRHSRQFAPGQKIRVILKGKGYFDGIIGESRYNFFTASIPSLKIADILKKESSVTCKVHRVGDAQYSFPTKVLFISSFTKPMFAQFKHTGKLRRSELRQDTRHKCEILCNFVTANLTKTKKGYIFVENTKDKFSGFIKDISSGGCAMSVRDDLNMNSYFKIKLKMLNEELDIPAKIVRSHKLGSEKSTRNLVHFKFIGISTRAKVTIQQYVYQLHPLFTKTKIKL